MVITYWLMSEKVIIIGGGLTGLICGYNILKSHPSTQLTIIESSNKLVGKI